MWILFCGGLGLSEEDVVNAEIHEKTQALINGYMGIYRLRSFQESLSAMYAYEFQVTEISIAKIEGLLSYYGMMIRSDFFKNTILLTGVLGSGDRKYSQPYAG